LSDGPRRGFDSPMRRPPPRSALFPYTTLFRSGGAEQREQPLGVVLPGVHQDQVEAAVDAREHLGRLAMVHGHAIEQAIGLDVLRSEEHTSELQSRENLVCRLLLEKKNQRGAAP